MITIPTIDVSPGVEVKDKFMPQCEYVRTLEDRNEDYIKMDGKIE